MAALVKERRESAVRVEEGRAQRHWSRAGSRDDADARATNFGDPVGELFGSPDGRREQEHTNTRRRQHDGLFPDVAALLVGEVVRLVEHDEVGLKLLAAAQSVEEL